MVHMETHIHLSQNEVLKAVLKAHIFSGIGLIEQKMLADKCVAVHCDPEDIIIEQGAVGDKLYIIVEGSVLISVKDMKVGRRRVNTLGPGDVFGEIALLRRIPRTARVSAITPCNYLSINSEDFFSVYQYFPARARDNIQLVMAKRLQELASYSH